MRLLKILLLQFQDVFEQRLRSFLWFFISLWGTMLFLLFWRGAAGNKMIAPGWDFTAIASYYFYLIVAGSLLMSNVEDDIARMDIYAGNLARYLLKPISYMQTKFLEDAPYRLVKTVYGILTCLICLFVFGSHFFVVNTNMLLIPFILVIIFCGYYLAFLFKFLLGLTAFWLKDIRGLYDSLDILMFILAGYTIPLVLAPKWLANLAYSLPFADMIYFPIIAFQGKLSFLDCSIVILRDFFWIGIFLFFIQVLWRRGLKKFTAVGQ